MACVRVLWAGVCASASGHSLLLVRVPQRGMEAAGRVSITTSRTPVSAHGGGYEYLVKTVAAGDGNLNAGDSLIRYYDEAGTPPGWWVGSGLAGFGDGRSIAEGSQVTEDQMLELFGVGNDPATGELLGAEYAADSRSGFDLTFQVPKSASALWAVADAGVQAQIVRAHHAAIKETLAIFEGEVLMTRVGKRGVAQQETRGLVAAAFDHFDSRAGDPHLHTHVLASNRVQGLDGKWRTLDSRAMYKAIVAMSRTHSALFADRVAEYLPVTWQAPTARKRELGEVEIVGVPAALRDGFSQRRLAIVAARSEAVAEFTGRHGREPNQREQRRLDYLTWATTRPVKDTASLAVLTEEWRVRAVRVLVGLGWQPRTGQGQDAAEWVREVLATAHERVPVLRADDLDEVFVGSVSASVLEVVQGKRATWTKWNLHSETAAQLMELRFATAEDRLRAIDRVVHTAQVGSVDLSAPRVAHTPALFLRGDGTSAFELKHGAVFTSTAVMEAEDFLLSRVHSREAPRVGREQVASVLAAFDESSVFALGTDQGFAVEQIAASGRSLDVMVGPAGAGKTTTLSALLEVWRAEHGPGTVVGLAPSAAAATVLGDELQITTDNTAKWLFELDRQGEKQQQLDSLLARQAVRPQAQRMAQITALREDMQRWQLRRGQLLIVDEASLAGTFALQRITAQAQEAGAKVVLVGDPGQLSSVEAGGGFSLAVRELGAQAPRLSAIHRFTNDWEAKASLLLRTGRAEALDTYFAQGRVHEGREVAVIDQAYAAWQRDQEQGKMSLLVAADNDTVQLLNARAQADLFTAGVVGPPIVAIREGLKVGTGDMIVTRQNDRTLTMGGRSWVKNGDRWQVVAAREDGALLVRREDGSPLVMLPSHYVAEQVELGYAATTHRAQGATVDTAHTLVVGDGLTREAFYVGMTRGKEANDAYVATLTLQDEEHHLKDGDRLTAREVLESVLSNSGAALSAHEVTVAEQEGAFSIARLADEYETIAVAGTEQRWVDVITRSAALDADTRESVLTSPAWKSLASALRRGTDSGTRLEDTFDTIAGMRTLQGVEDPAAVLAHRVDAYVAASGPRRVRPQLIAGLLPTAQGVSDPDLSRALQEREELIVARAHGLVERAREQGLSWAIPGSAHSLTVAAYRDRWGVGADDTRPLGGEVGRDFDQRTQHARAAAALASVAAVTPTPVESFRPDTTPVVPGRGPRMG